MRYLHLLPLLIFLISCTKEEPSQPEWFEQIVQRNIALPEGSGTNILALHATSNDKIWVVTDREVWRVQDSTWASAVVAPIVLAGVDQQQNLWIIAEKELMAVDQKQTILLPSLSKIDTITSVYWTDSTIWLGSKEKLHFYKNDVWTTVPELNTKHVTGIIQDSNKQIWVATLNGLWRQEGEKWWRLDDSIMPAANEGKYYSLTTLNEGKNITFGTPASVGVISSDGNHTVWNGSNGLPYGPVRVIKEIAGELWMGTYKGAIQKGEEWRYWNGRRWLPGDQVNDFLEVASNVVWIATDKGIAEIKKQSMTLEQKAAYYEHILQKRHNRRGLINYSHLAIPGDTASSFMQNEDNDGLWTACYLAAACYRYAVDPTHDNRQKAIEGFEALERLETVTGISGYPARSYARASDTVVQSRSPHPKKWHLSKDGQWQWLDDTSSDEITGHMYSLSLFYELVASESEKVRVVALIDRIATHIVDNNYYLIDTDGLPTRWGVWNPDSLNHSSNWLTERGLNSLQILSHLKTAYHFTGNEKFETAYQYLANDHGYLQNAIKAKNYGPFETSHSDDILNFFPYFGLMNYSGKDEDRGLFVQSLERTWEHVAADRMPVWNVMASAFLMRDCGLDVAKKELQDYPLDLIDWTMENSHRWDIIVDPLVDRGGNRQAVTPISSLESSVSRWNTNPKRLDSGRNGRTEESGSYYLMAYWMGRYYGYW